MRRRVVDPMHEAELLFGSLTGEIRDAANVRDPGDWRTVARLAGRAQRHARELAVDAELEHEHERGDVDVEEVER